MSKGMDKRKENEEETAQDTGGEARGEEGKEGHRGPLLALTAPVRGCHDAARRRLNGAVAAGHLLGRPVRARTSRTRCVQSPDPDGRPRPARKIHRPPARLPHPVGDDHRGRGLQGSAGSASHARGGRRTRRVEPLYGEGGTTYVYLVYGPLAAQLRHRRGRPPGSRAGAGVLAGTADAPEPVPGRGGWPGIWASTSVSMASTRRRRGASGSRTAGSRFPHMRCAAGRASGSITRARTGLRGPGGSGSR